MINKNVILGATLSAFLSIAAISVLPANSYSAGKDGRVLPSAGIDYTLSNDAISVKKIKDEIDSNKTTTTSLSGVTDSANATTNASSLLDNTETATSSVEKVVEETVEATSDKTLKETERDIDARKEEEGFKNLVIAKVNTGSWVNVRADATTDSEIVGKLYDKSAGEYLEEKDGWYKISSGSCTGYVSADYCVTGEDAVELAKQVGTRVCTVDTTTLYVRAENSTDSAILGMVPLGEVLTVSEELDGWAKVNIEEGDGYVSLDYVKLSTEFVKAESKEEEEARLAKEEAARQEAIRAAEAANAKNNKQSTNSNKKQTVYATGEGSELGRQVANYALQFVGNPYVYGGTSLTNGADCSGFVLSVYKHFGVSLPHSANADRSQGYAVAGVENAWPGDLICYSGHVGIYIGGGQIVHASTAKTGIKVSKVSYRSVLAVRRIF